MPTVPSPHLARKFIFDLLIVRAQMLSFEAIENIEADKVVELFPGRTSNGGDDLGRSSVTRRR